jgi:uncharacterized spore protein YtfJ
MMTQPKIGITNSQTLEQTMSRLVNIARTDAVFGQPVQRDGVTIIPCSEVALGLGLGGGSTPRQNVSAEQKQEGEGIGGGGGVREHPVAVIVMTTDGVRVRPIPNVTRIAGSLFTAAACAFLWLARRNQKARASMFGRQLARTRLTGIWMPRQTRRRWQKRARLMALAMKR